MSLDSHSGTGTDYEVQDQDFYKRAVMKPAPTCFTVEVLAPMKQGKAHSYGVRIIPVNPRQIQMLRESGDDLDGASVHSIGKEYEIWRRWDDCLDFQYKLEAEYERMSREKKRELRYGKRGSNDSPNGVYRNPNAASSFESLPEGPDPKGINIDLHAYIPRLTKKSSFFSVSDATVQKRAEEFAAMIYGIFKQDCPKLIEQLRDSSTVRDFFAWWRRDQDLLEKRPQRPQSAMSSHKSGPSPSSSRASVDSSFVFPTPPSPDSPGFSMLKRQEKVYVHPQRSPTESSMSSPTSVASPQIRSAKILPSPPTSPEHQITSPMKRSRSPMALRSRGGTPQLQISRPMPHPQYEDRSLLSPPTDSPRTRSPAPQSRVGNLFGRLDIRQAQAHRTVASTDGSSDSSTPPITPPHGTFNPPRERPVSQLSMESIDSADIAFDLSFIKLEPAPPGTKARLVDASGRNKRDSILSVSSLTSIRTTDSAEGVLGRDLRRRSRVSQRQSRRRDGPWSPDSRLSVAVPEEDESVFYHSDDSQGEDADPFALEIDSAFDDTMSYMEKLDSFPDVPGQGPNGESDTGVRSYYRDRDWRMSFPASVRESIYDPDFDLYDGSEPSSPTSTIHGVQPSESGHSDYSTSTITSLALEPGMCAVKAKYDDVIVALRLPLGTPLSTLRARLSEKFAQAQGVQLHYRFGLAYAVPRRFSQTLRLPAEDEMPIILSPAALSFSDSGRGSRPLSTHPSGLDSASPLKRLVPIWSQDDWETAIHNCGNKLVLHVFDQEVR